MKTASVKPLAEFLAYGRRWRRTFHGAEGQPYRVKKGNRDAFWKQFRPKGGQVERMRGEG